MSFNVRNGTLHAIIDEPADLRSFLQPHCDSPDFLLELGAVYLNKKRQWLSTELSPGDYVRAHLRPRRFLSAHVDWSKIVKYECPQFLIVDKPAGLPVHSTLDNFKENLVALLSQARNESLYGTHRLDQPTQGLVVIARTKSAASLFHRWLRKRKVVKRYRAWTEKAVPVGRHTHFMQPSSYGAKTLFAEESPGLLRCELEVLSCRAFSEGFETLIQLHTGRTHQIRAQLSFLKAPLVGDSLYGGKTHDYLGLQSFYLAFPDPVNYRCELPTAPWSPL